MRDGLHTLPDGRVVELQWEPDEMTVWTHGESRQRIGSIVFVPYEGDRPDGRDDYYLVVNMHLEGPGSTGTYARQGIGQEIIERVREDRPIVFGPDDGSTRDDGSHLTGFGSAFARKMVALGLATREGDESLDDDDW